ncbi:hypothetical protein FGB62_133g06 [Gracilaria domingensis]|nr:hypothetical protein FGB62_133g06 [Gracilaria domingensis]
MAAGFSRSTAWCGEGTKERGSAVDRWSSGAERCSERAALQWQNCDVERGEGRRANGEAALQRCEEVSWSGEAARRSTKTMERRGDALDRRCCRTT